MKKYKIKIKRGNPKKYEGKKVWEWWVQDGQKTVAGGICATKADAKNDASIWVRDEGQANSD